MCDWIDPPSSCQAESVIVFVPGIAKDVLLFAEEVVLETGMLRRLASFGWAGSEEEV